MTNSELKTQLVWPILVIGLAIIIIGVGAVVFFSQGLAVSSAYDVDFPPSQEMIDKWNDEYFATASGFSRILIPIHLTMVLLAFLAVIAFREPIIQRIGLNKSNLPNWSYPVFMLAEPLTWIIGSLIVVYFIGEPSERWINISNAFNRTEGIDMIVILCWGTLGASFAEEVFFRGYLLKGLIRRWNPWLTIALTSIFFAAIHGGPDFMLYILPMGVYFGILVWRTGSIWPAIACHAFSNILITSFCRYHDMDSAGIWANPSYLEIIVLIISAIAMVFAARLLMRKTENIVTE